MEKQQIQDQPFFKPVQSDIISSKLIQRNSLINEDQVLVRISQDDIICKQKNQQSLIQSIICPICLLTLPLPFYECEQCNNSFCPICLEDWWRKNPNDKKQCVFKCQNAHFKIVKRSNTFNALMDALQFKCKLCFDLFPLSQYQKHSQKLCPELIINCVHQGCNFKQKKKNLQAHQTSCQYRPIVCQHCFKKYPQKQINQHLQNCYQRKITCEYVGCDEVLRKADYVKHIKACNYKKQKCQWCFQQMYIKDLIQHEVQCDKKTIQCRWCKKQFKLLQMMEHVCLLRQEVCQLCEVSVLSEKSQQHKKSCMFKSLVVLKRQNKYLLQKSESLQKKVQELQYIINDSITNRQENTLQLMRKFKDKQKRQLQKDLQRIQYSLKSISKLKQQEVDNHMRFPHLTKSWCLTCKGLQAKFKQMKEPLVAKQKELTQKLNQINKFQQTCR